MTKSDSIGRMSLKEKFEDSYLLFRVNHHINRNVTNSTTKAIRRLLPYKLKRSLKLMLVIVWYSFKKAKASLKNLKYKSVSVCKRLAFKLEYYFSIHQKNERQVKEIFRYSKRQNLSVLQNQPLVSILMLNRNGLEHLKRFFEAYPKYTLYKNVEFVIVDNNSTDGSLAYIDLLVNVFDIKIIRNGSNETFSFANNQATKLASGEYFLLLNNDVVPTTGWLTQMVQTLQSDVEAGAIGARLIYPNKAGFDRSLCVQHAGLHFQREVGIIRPYNSGNGLKWDHKDVSMSKGLPGVTAACLLVERDKYVEVGGLTESYVYGYEDVDFCLKLAKKGYKNIYCAKSILFHYEFGTQAKNTPEEVQKRRYNNIVEFRSNWHEYLERKINEEKYQFQNPFWNANGLHIAFAVTDNDKATTAGDFFTALELGQELEKKGVKISYLSRLRNQWYDFDETIDVVISLLDAFNPKEVRTKGKPLLVAWARNWFERWCQNEGIQGYDIFMASSKKAQDFMIEQLKRPVEYFPIATNPERFLKTKSSNKLTSDYCFTGSRWGEPRNIERCLIPGELPFSFKVFGANWVESQVFKNFDAGFVNYVDLPSVYRSTKLLVDDANRVTCEWGSVNSRVFDALGQGLLCLTNGRLGSEETFNGLLPTYSSKDDLHKLVDHYLSNDEDREAVAKKLQLEVLAKHTYKIRTGELLEILKGAVCKKSLVILSPSPNKKVAKEWGDYHLALAIQKYMKRRGVDTDVKHLQEWNDLDVLDYSSTFLLRGLSTFNPKPFQKNLMWLISHPDKVKIDELNRFDHIFVASSKYRDHIKERLAVPSSVMLQCADLEVMVPDYQEKFSHNVLLIGNSRKVLRDSLGKLLGQDLDVSVYGNHWQDLIPSKWIKGIHVYNEDLKKYYSSATVLLNDHWKDMKEQGFISNRIFDALACGAHLVTDNVEGLSEVFSTPLCVYESKEDLLRLIQRFEDNDAELLTNCKKLHTEVISKHGYGNRIDQIYKVLV